MGARGVLRVGAHEVAIVTDGAATYDPADVFPGVEPDRLRVMLAGRLDAAGSLPIPYSPLLVRTAEGIVLVDAGAGEALAAEWGDPVGRTAASLAAAGVVPEDVSLVLISHAHADHVGGLTLEREGGRVARYPNARHVLSAAEWAFWVEEEHAPGFRSSLARIARLHLQPIRDAGLLELTEGEREVAPGVRVIPAPGHTPGHVAIEIASGSAQLLDLADAVLHEWAFEHPEWTAVTEVDPVQATATRRRLLDRAARGRSLVHAYHLAQLGFVERAGDAFRFIAATPA